MGRRNGNERDGDTDSVYEEERQIVQEIVDDVCLGTEVQRLREEKEMKDTRMRALSSNMYKLDDDMTSISDTTGGLKQSKQKLC